MMSATGNDFVLMSRSNDGVPFARQPGHGAVEPQIAFRLVHEQIRERDFAFVRRAGDDELAGADAFDRELEIDHLHGAGDVVVERRRWRDRTAATVRGRGR